MADVNSELQADIDYLTETYGEDYENNIDDSLKEQLKKLDKKAKQTAFIFSLTFGIICSLILGITRTSINFFIKVDLPVLTGPTTPM